MTSSASGVTSVRLWPSCGARLRQEAARARSSAIWGFVIGISLGGDAGMMQPTLAVRATEEKGCAPTPGAGVGGAEWERVSDRRAA
ncbi:hypothetical protein GCM10022261_07530 [Brevibacterium daeguense]|uniref:Uncharacterized protein n=1 Tax=Brevibacterium daeguense TaxID=909936 RepID=A0ABP8EGY4_9MICO